MCPDCVLAPVQLALLRWLTTGLHTSTMEAAHRVSRLSAVYGGKEGDRVASHEVPVLEGPFWPISNNPDLGVLGAERQEVVDHAIFQSRDGCWHLWACIRGTAIGRLLYRWESETLKTPHWQPQGVAMRAAARYGESLDDWNGEEWLQAPHVIERRGLYYMFYGGHRSETGECQICVAMSVDGRRFRRHRNRHGFSRVFVGPGEARDPMILQIGRRYHCYYSGHDPGAREPCKIYCRTSLDLLHWSNYVAVNWGGSAGSGPWSAECPFVVQRNGLYYLFRTSRYQPPAECHVYCSSDPLDFGLGDDCKKVACLRVAAPEVTTVGERYYISTVEDLCGGVQLGRLCWVPASTLARDAEC